MVKKKWVTRKFLKRRRFFKVLIPIFFDGLARVDYRLFWYAIVLWLFSVILSGLVMLPWFYPVFGVVTFFLTAMFMEKVKISKREVLKNSILKKGLWVAFCWTVTIFILDIWQFVGFNFGSLNVYFSDPRNWFKYPLVILLPIIYSLIFEDMQRRRLTFGENQKTDRRDAPAGIGA